MIGSRMEQIHPARARTLTVLPYNSRKTGKRGGDNVLTRPYVSRRHLLGGSITAFAADALAPRPSRAASTLTLVDTVSGANFQAFWKTYLIPTISQKTGIDIKYTVGSGPPLQLQMQSWRDGEPGFSLMFLKDLDLANMVAAGTNSNRSIQHTKRKSPTRS